MTQAERAMELTAAIHVVDSLQKMAAKHLQMNAPRVVGGLPTKLSEMKLELTELKRQMGGSERRAFTKLYVDWSNRRPT